MDFNELLSELESNPQDGSGLEKTLLQLIDEGNLSELESLLGNLVPSLQAGQAGDTALKVLEQIFRRNRESDAGQILAWWGGWLAWKVIDDPMRAESFFKHLTSAGDNQIELDEFYRVFYASRGNWLRLEQYVGEACDRRGVDATEAKRILAKTAQEFDNPSKELSYWQAVVGAEPNDEEADAQLERLYTQMGRWPSLADLLKGRLGRLGDDEVQLKVSILRGMLTIYEDKMKAEPRVLATYQQILDIDPTNIDAIDALLERYEKSARWPDYVKTLAKKIDAVSDKAEKIALLEHQANMMETRFSNVAEALKIYERILELAPDRRDVVEKLKDLYERRRDFESLIRLRRVEAEQTTDLDERVKVFAELAKTASDSLRKPPLAIELWEKVLEIDPVHMEGLRELDGLYEREKDYDQQCGVLSRLIDLSHDEDEQVTLLEKLAGIQGSRLNDASSALESWRRILDVRENHDRAKRELRSRYLAEERFEDLEVFMRRFATVEELGRTLESKISGIEDEEKKLWLLFKVAEIWRDETNQPQKAVRHLETVLGVDPRNLRAATELIELNRQLGDWRKLPAVYEVAIAETADPGERTRLMLQAAQVYEVNLANLERAFFWYLQAFKENLLDDSLRAQAERLAGPSDNWDIFVIVLEGAARQIPDENRQVATWLRVGQIYSEELNEGDAAQAAFQEALTLDPENRLAVNALDDLYRKMERWPELVTVLERRLSIERRAKERQILRFDIAQILYHSLNRADDAISVYEDILAEDPQEVRAFAALGDLLLAEEKFAALKELLERQINVFTALERPHPAILADLHCRVATLSCVLEGATASATESCAMALEYDPQHAEAISLLESLLGEKDLRIDIVNLLRKPYELAKRWQDLADLLEIELAEIGDTATSAETLWRLEGLYRDNAVDADKRFRTLSRILKVTPEDSRSWDAIERVAGEVDGWREVASLYEAAAYDIQDSEAQVQINLRLARIEWQELNNIDHARRAYHDVLANDETNVDALDALETIYEEIGDHPELLKIYQRRFDVSPYPGEQIAYAFKIADEQAQHLENIEGAIEAVKKVLDIEPDSEMAYRRLDGLYFKAERWYDLASVLEQRIVLAQELSDRSYLRLRLAEVYEYRLEDVPGAVEVFSLILGEDSANEDALRELERLFANEDVRVSVAKILLPTYKVQENFVKLVEVYDVLAGAEGDTEVRLSYFATIAEIYENKIQDLDKAFEYRAKAFREMPDREELLNQVLRVGEAKGALDDAIFVLIELVFDISDPERRKETHRVIASVCRDKGIDRELSKRHYTEILGLDPEDMDAIDSLISLRDEDGEVDILVSLLVRKAEIVMEPERRAGLLLWAGDLYSQKLEKPEDAIASYTEVLDMDPANGHAILALEALYEQSEEWMELVEVLGRKADVANTPQERVAALKKQGLIQHERLDASIDAIETFLVVLSVDGEDVDAMRTLDRFYGSVEDWTSQYDILAKIYERVEGEDRLTMRFRMGRLLEQNLGDPYKAIEIYRDLLAEFPDNVEAVDALEGMVRAGDAAEPAFAVLKPILANRAEWQRLYVNYEVLTEREHDPVRKVANLVTMGEIAQNQMNQPISGFECFGKAFTTDPLNRDVLGRVYSLAESFDMWHDVPALLQEAAAEIEGMPQALELLLQAGAVLRDRLENREAAIEVFESILKDFSDNMTALDALDELYSGLEKWEDQIRILRFKYDVKFDPEAKIQVLLRLADVCEFKVNRTQDALEARQEALYLHPGQPQAVLELRRMFDEGKHLDQILEILEPIYQESGAYSDLATIYEASLVAIEDPDHRKETLLKLAEVWAQNLGEGVTALGWFGKALELDPGDEVLEMQIDELAASVSAWESLLSIQLTAAQACDNNERKIALWHKAVQSARDRIGDYEKAEAICKWILELNDSDALALADLDRMYLSQGRDADLLAILKREVEVAEYDDDKIKFLMRAGTLQRDKLDDLEGAIESFAHVVRIDEMQLQALTALADLYDMRNDFEPLFRTLSLLSDMAQTGEERAALQRRLAIIAEEKLGRKDDALALWDEVAAASPTDAGALQQLQRLYRDKEDWEALIEVCEREINATAPEVDRIVVLLREIGVVGETKLDDPNTAQHAHVRLLEFAPGDRESLEALRRLYLETGDLESLSGVLEQLYNSEMLSQDEKNEICLEHAKLLTDELAKPEEAIVWWNLVLNTDPQMDEGLTALDQLYENTGRFADCVRIIERRAEKVEGDERASLLIRAAELQNGPLNDPAAAADTLEVVTGLQPANMDVSHELQSLYMRLEDWDKLAAVLLRRDEHFGDDLDGRISNLGELARIYETNKGAADLAFYVWVKAAQLHPEDHMAVSELWRLAQELGMWTEYVDSLSEAVNRMPEESKREHLLRFGEVMWRNAERDDQAIGWFEKVKAEWPEDETALAALHELYLGSHRWEELVGVVNVQIELTPDFMEKISLGLLVGDVLENKINDLTRALEAYKLVLSFDEGSIAALDALIRIHESRNEWEDLLKALDLKAPLVPEEEVQIRMLMGAILEAKVGDANRAIAAYEAVLDVEPTNEPALEHLKDLYGGMHNWLGLADVYERKLGQLYEVAERIHFSQLLAMLYETALDDKQRALDYWMQILDMDRVDEEAFETAARLLTEMEDWNELINLFENRIASVKDERDKMAALVRLAKIHEERVEDINSAIATHQRVLDIDDRKTDSYAELERLFGLVESWEDVVDTLLKWTEHSDSTAQLLELSHRAVDVVLEKLENPDRAAQLLKDLLQTNPNDVPAYNKLRDIYASLEDWERVADVFLDQEAQASTDEERAKHRAAAGDIYLNRLKDRNKAILHFERSMELNPKQDNVALGLARSYVAAERWEKAQPLLESLLESPDAIADSALAAKIHYNMGVCSERLLDYEKAFREYQAAAQLTPDDPETLMGLGRMYQRKQFWQLSKDRYVRALSVGGDALDQKEVAAVNFALGEVCIELGEFEEAAKYLDQSLAIQPDQARATDLQITLAEKRGDWPAVIRYRQARAESRGDIFEKFSVMLEVGDIYRLKMNNVYGAAAAYKEALEMNPGAKVPLIKLFELYLQAGNIEDALFTMEELARAEDSPSKRAGHYMTMAAIYQQKLNDDIKAVEYLNAALDEDPDELQAFRAIDEILTKNRDWKRQADAYQRMLERLVGRNNPELEFKLLFALGEIFRSRLKQNEEAIEVYERATKLQPSDRRAHEILAQLYEVIGDYNKAVAEHVATVSADPLSGSSVESYRAMMRLYRTLAELDKAFMVASVMVALGIAGPEEKAFFENNLEPNLPWFKGTIDPLRWENHLVPSGGSNLLGRILQVLLVGLGEHLGTKDLKDLGLKKRSEMDLGAKLLFVNVYKAVAKVLGPLPHKVYRNDNPVGLTIEFLTPPALIVGSDMLTGHDEREIGFLIGRQLAYMNPMYFLAAVKNISELKAFLGAAIKFCRPDTQLGAGADIVLHYVRQIERRMPQQQKNQLMSLIDELFTTYPTGDFGTIFEDFFQLIELTSLRAGMLISGSVPTVLGILQVEDLSFSGMPQKERLEEVVRFAVSENHFVLRRALGVAVEAT